MSKGFMEAFGIDAGALKPFRAAVRYFPAMDCAIYLKEDCSYRSARVSKKLSLLLDPYVEERVVGVKIKGVQHLVEQLLSIVDGKIPPEMRIKLSQLLMMALVSEEEAMLALSDAVVERRKQLAARAKAFLKEEEELFVELPFKIAA